MAKQTTIVERIAVGSFVIFTDIVGVILFFFGLDDFFILDIIALPITVFYFIMKGVRGEYNLVANLLEIVPYLGAAPIRSIGFLVQIMKMRRKAGLPTKAAQKPEENKEIVPAPSSQ
jgi:hypothetical protein